MMGKKKKKDSKSPHLRFVPVSHPVVYIVEIVRTKIQVYSRD